VKSDADLLTAAIDVATGGNRSAFARLLGHADASTVRRYLRGDRDLPTLERRLCRAIVAHPSVARWLAIAAEQP
jgi:hypothetical protein